MSAEQIQSKILKYLQSGDAREIHPKKLARELEVEQSQYGSFRQALRELMKQGRVMLGAQGSVLLPTNRQGGSGAIIGTYKHHRKGFGFVIPRDPQSHEDVFIPQGQNNGAITGDIVSVNVTNQQRREGKTLFEGRITEVVERTQTRFVGTLVKQGTDWLVMPDGNAFTEPIRTPDAASRHVKPGTKVVVEMTTYPEDGVQAQGVISEILGKQGEKDVDLRSVIVQFNLPQEFSEEVLAQARQAIAKFNSQEAWGEHRYDLSNEVICTIDPPDAKDYDDAISLRKKDDGLWELGVHIADVSYFVPEGSPLDEEAHQRGNSCYFPGHVIPMLPEILSNGVCSLQEAVPRLCKSVFITFDDSAKPIRAKFANTVIRSAKRLRYLEAQAIIDGDKAIPHPDGAKTIADYPPDVVALLKDMDELAHAIQKRRHAEGQVVLELPEVELVLDEEGKVVGTRKEDESFTHTLIEMFMVEANEAVARLFDSIDVPFMRRVHPEPAVDSSERLRHFVEVAGYKLPKDLDRKALQHLLASVRGKPESFALNLAVLKSLARAEYSPEPLGHYALASQHYCHFTSPIRRYADLLVHRLLDSFIKKRESMKGTGKKKVKLEDFIPYNDLREIGRHISFTERRADDAERELRQVKILELLKARVGEIFPGVVTGITNFGIFVQIQEYLVDGLIRYEDLMDDWWDVDERAGRVRGQRTGTRIGIGDEVKVQIVTVDVARRELTLAVSELVRRSGGEAIEPQPVKPKQGKGKNQKGAPRGGGRQQGPHRGQGRTHGRRR
jgi:ribonuclease R